MKFGNVYYVSNFDIHISEYYFKVYPSMTDGIFTVYEVEKFVESIFTLSFIDIPRWMLHLQAASSSLRNSLVFVCIRTRFAKLLHLESFQVGDATGCCSSRTSNITGYGHKETL